MALGLWLPSSHSLYSSPYSPTTSFSNRKAFSLPSLISSFHGIRIQSYAAKALRPPSLRESGGRMLVRAAKREEELKELRGRSTEELNEEVIDLKGELFMLRLQRSARNEFKSSEFRRMRKRIARMLTIKREREIEQGINKRLSRNLDKKWKRSIVVRPAPSLRKKQEEDQKAAETKKSA